MMVSLKLINTRINKLKEKERTLLAIVLMNGGKIPAVRLKRIYLEKNTLWDLENAKSNLIKMGFLQGEDNLGSTQFNYYISKDVRKQLTPLFSDSDPGISLDFEAVLDNKTCCGEYSVLWYLMQTDINTNLSAFWNKKRKNSGRSLQKVQDALLVGEEDARYIIKVLLGILDGKIFEKNSIKQWADILRDPSELIKKIFKMQYYDLRDGDVLGREEFGKDNVDFLLDEIMVLDEGLWISLDYFISNAKSTLFSANQPFRWIHFEEEALWRIFNREFRILGLLNTYLHNGSKYFSLTDLGAYCLGKTSDDDLHEKLNLRHGKFTVHPNFEITLIAREIHPKVLLELSMFTDPVVLDTMSVFKMSRGSIRRGLKFGLSQDRIMGFLSEHNRTDIPQNVEYSVLDWGR